MAGRTQLIFAGEYTSAEDAAWHTDHFCCWLCDAPLAGRQYTPIDGQPHCLDCYQRKYGKVHLVDNWLSFSYRPSPTVDFIVNHLPKLSLAARLVVPNLTLGNQT